MNKLNLEIVDINDMGQGVAKLNGKVYFVNGAVIGDIVLAEVTSNKKSYSVANIIEFIKPSVYRKEEYVFSKDFHDLGLSLYPLKYEYQAMVKNNKLLHLLQNSKLKSKPTLNKISSEVKNDRYRNKGTFPVGGVKGDIKIGVYKRFSHEVIELDDYFIMPENFNLILKILKKFFSDIKIEPYDEVKNSGVLRQVVLRKNSFYSYMLGFVVNKKINLDLNPLILEFNKNKLDIKSIVLNINSKKGNSVLGRENYVLYGDEYIIDTIGDFEYKLKLDTFFQVNRYETVNLYDKVKNIVKNLGGKTVWDLYCGVGTIGIYMSDIFENIMGIEVVKPAIDMAIENAEINGLNNYHFESGKVEELITVWKKRYGIPDVVILDPPRKGVDKKVLDTIYELGVKDIVYVSCKPSTLIRDIKILEEYGYRAKELTGFDLFLGTVHCECVVLMTKV